ncbi:MAG: hypothetical protein ACYSWP_11475, partial [Planctomycetota bacterium]
MSDVWNVGVARVDSEGNLFLDGEINYSSDSVVTVPSSKSSSSSYSNLVSSYNSAKLLTPNGSPLSATNRACILLQPSEYDIGSNEF